MSGLLKRMAVGVAASGLVGSLALVGWTAGSRAVVTVRQSSGGDAVPTTGAPQQIALTNQEQATLRQGRVLLTGEEGNYTARVLASGSVDTAWAVLTDYNNFSSFLPGVESSRLLESSGDRREFEQVNVIRIFPLTHRERTVIAATESYPSKIAFSMVEGDLRKLQGAWTITGAGEQVMVTHQVAVEPASNRTIFFNIYKDNLQKTMAALKQEIERR